MDTEINDDNINGNGLFVVDEDFRSGNCVYDSLTEEQELICDELIYRSENDIKYRVLITGSAGVGKTKLSLTIIKKLRITYKDDRSVLVMAPTGKSAVDIGGMTIHSSLLIPINYNGKNNLISDSKVNKLKSDYNKTKVIFIDEISMVGITIWNKIDETFRRIFNSNEYFGGLSVIIVGDFNQLNPVKDQSILDIDLSKYGFEIYRLTKSIRHKNDKDFLNLLNKMVDSKISAKDVEILKQRQSKMVPYDLESTHLFVRNESIDTFLSNFMRKNNITPIKCSSEDVIVFNKNDYSLDECKKKLKKLKRYYFFLPEQVDIMKNMKYMLIYNIDVSDKLVNGALGILKEYTTAFDFIEILWLEFSDKSIGQMRRKKDEDKFKTVDSELYQYIKKGWVPIYRYKRNYAIYDNRNHILEISREQFPVILANAITIHKSQGLTISDNIVIHLEDLNEFFYPQGANLIYTAFSRGVSLDKITIIGNPCPLFYRFFNEKKCDNKKDETKKIPQIKLTNLLN